MKIHTVIVFFFLVASSLIAEKSHAHEPDFSYIWLNVSESGLEGRFEADRNDLVAVTGIALDPATGITREQGLALQNYLADHMAIGDDNGPFPLTLDTPEFSGDTADFNEEVAQFVVIYFTLDSPLPVPAELTITYSGIMHALPQHRGGFHFESNFRTGVVDNYVGKAYIHAPGRETVKLSTYNNNRMRQFMSFLKEGLTHIWAGIDHILFLVTLLLTSVLVRNKNEWRPTDGLRAAVWNVVAIVTVFTVAHSITLGLAMRGWIELPSRFVESVIALSILAVVVDNFYSYLGRFKWSAVFVFGLFHGLGFASVLEDMTADFHAKVLALLGFNIGVEIGQLAIVLVVFPILYFARNYRYQNLVLRPASAVIGIVSCWWLIQRSFDLSSGWTSF